MQNQYFGDISDFYKYYFLKNISLEYKLGINWLLTPNDGSNAGKHIITKRKDVKLIDEKLYMILEKSILINDRNILNIEKDYFNNNTKYFNDLYEKYFLEGIYEENAFNYLINQDIIYFDPDNGIEIESIKKGNKYKYLSYRQILRYWNENKSLIIFQFKDFKKYSIYDKFKNLIECLKCLEENILIINIERVYYFCLINNNHKGLKNNILNFIDNNKELKYNIIKSAHLA